ncbi:MAG: hypothetical protein CMN75_15335 [Spirochaeta sp.]|nr:hypothetical protein [Spirochaeta sp.]
MGDLRLNRVHHIGKQDQALAISFRRCSAEVQEEWDSDRSEMEFSAARCARFRLSSPRFTPRLGLFLLLGPKAFKAACP